jgi:hypothetical protein
MYDSHQCYLKGANATLSPSGSAAGVTPCRAAMSIVAWALRHANQSGAAFVNGASTDACIDMGDLVPSATLLNVTSVSMPSGRRLDDQSLLPGDFNITSTVRNAADCIPLLAFSVASVLSLG